MQHRGFAAEVAGWALDPDRGQPWPADLHARSDRFDRGQDRFEGPGFGGFITWQHDQVRTAALCLTAAQSAFDALLSCGVRAGDHSVGGDDGDRGVGAQTGFCTSSRDGPVRAPDGGHPGGSQHHPHPAADKRGRTGCSTGLCSPTGNHSSVVRGRAERPLPVADTVRVRALIRP